jgi:hypothetical protein
MHKPTPQGVRELKFGMRASSPGIWTKRRLPIRMVAALAEVAERNGNFGRGIRFGPTGSGPADEIGRMEIDSPTLAGHKSSGKSREGRDGCGVGFEPTTFGRADEIGRQENDSPTLAAHKFWGIKSRRKKWLRGSDLNRRPPAGPMKSADRKMTARFLWLMDYGN